MNWRDEGWYSPDPYNAQKWFTRGKQDRAWGCGKLTTETLMCIPHDAANAYLLGWFGYMNPDSKPLAKLA